MKNKIMANTRCIILLTVLILKLVTAYENIALNKTAYQQYPHTGNAARDGNANNAVDGLKSDRRAWGGQCVVSEARKRSATLVVDLASVSCISHIILYYMTGEKEWGRKNEFTKEFLGFRIYISNNTDKSQGILCFKDSESNVDNIPDVFNITCSVHGRYVIYYNERLEGHNYPNDYSEYAYNGLCEVEVYGLNNCSILCPDRNCHCCNNGTKMCKGCKPGYQGKHCEIELNEKRCGYCSDLSKCNYASSTCLDIRLPDMKQNDSKQENQLRNSFERQTITLGKLILTCLILIFFVLLILVWIVLRSRNSKKSKQQEYTAVPSEEPIRGERKSTPAVCRGPVIYTNRRVKGRNSKKSKQQGHNAVPTVEPSKEDSEEEPETIDIDVYKNDDDSSMTSDGYGSKEEPETTDIDDDNDDDDSSMRGDGHDSS